MAVVDLLEITPLLPPGAPLLGLDIGQKTIGLALSDGSLTIATPAETIRRTKFTADAKRLAAIVAARGCVATGPGAPGWGGPALCCEATVQRAAVYSIPSSVSFVDTLAAGIIDHETGTRDMRRINGLWKYMPHTATLAMVAAAAMAGANPSPENNRYRMSPYGSGCRSRVVQSTA